MKKRFFAIFAALSVFAIAMAGCPVDNGDDGTDTNNNNNSGGNNNNGGPAGSAAAVLNSLSINGGTITVPTAVGAAAWGNTTSLSGLTGAQRATLNLMTEVESAAISWTASEKATVTYAVSQGGTSNLTFGGGATVKLEFDTYVVVRVVSENAKTTNYYVVNIKETGTFANALSNVKIGSGAQTPTNANANNDTLAGITGAADIHVSNTDANAAVTFAFSGDFAQGKWQVAVIGEAAQINEANDFSAPAAVTASGNTISATWTPTAAFAEGNQFFIKLTSSNGQRYHYYKFKIRIGWDANLATFKFGTTASALNITPLRIGEPVELKNDINTSEIITGFAGAKAALDMAADTQIGRVQFQGKQPNNGYFFNATAVDATGAQLRYTVDGGANWTDFTATAQQVIFADNTKDVIYVEVKSSNGKATSYYKMQLTLKRNITIPYGSPSSWDLSAITKANPFPDAAWDNATDWLTINRWNNTETNDWQQMPASERTHGRAKLLWDEDGIWVYAQVWEKTISPDPGSHEQSSLELFINEAYSADVTSGAVTGDSDPGNGGQYRLGANGEATGSPSQAVTAFTNLNQNAAKKWTGTDAFPFDKIDSTTTVTNGYVVVFHAPWRFDTAGKFPLVEDKLISMELQINAMGSAGTRVGVLNWNNNNSNSYAALDDYGEAVLDWGSLTELPPKRPSITTQPQGGGYAINKLPELSVVAEHATAGASFNYQWVQVTDGDATDISGANSSTFTPSNAEIPSAGTYYFFVKVTATVGSVTSAPVNSATAAIKIVDPANPPVFHLDLSKERVTGWGSIGGTHTPATSATASSISWTFPATDDQKVAIALTDEQIAEILYADSLEITITGTSTDDTTSAGRFRYYLANHAGSSSGWNGTNSSNANVTSPWAPGGVKTDGNADQNAGYALGIGSASGVMQKITFAGTNQSQKTAANCSSFLLRVGSGTEQTVTITDIQIKLVYKED